MDELRADQRRALRLIPLTIFTEAVPRVGPDTENMAPQDRPLVEALLRAEAKELLADRDLAKALEGLRQLAQVETLDAFYASNRERAEDLAVGAQAAFVDQADLARMAREEAERAVMRVDDAPTLRRLLLLLVWADRLSDYTDPRLDDLPPDPVESTRSDRYVVPAPAAPAAPPTSGDTGELPTVQPSDETTGARAHDQ